MTRTGKIKLFIGAMLILGPTISSSNEPGVVSLESSVGQTSDNLLLRTNRLSISNNRRSFVYPYENAEQTAWDFGIARSQSAGTAASLHFDHTLTEAWLGKKYLDQFYLKVLLGRDELESMESDSFTKYLAQAEYKASDFYAQVSYGHRSTVYDFRYPKALESYLKSHLFEVVGLWMPSKFRIKLFTRQESLSDDNDAGYRDLDVKYNLSSSGYWLLAGAGVEHYQNSKQVIGYWTPETFISYGPRFEASGPLFGNFNFNLALNLNRFEDENQDHGEGYYLNVALQSSDRNKNHFKVGYEKIQSTQRSDIWTLSRPYFSYNHFW